MKLQAMSGWKECTLRLQLACCEELDDVSLYCMTYMTYYNQSSGPLYKLQNDALESYRFRFDSEDGISEHGIKDGILQPQTFETSLTQPQRQNSLRHPNIQSKYNLQITKHNTILTATLLCQLFLLVHYQSYNMSGGRGRGRGGFKPPTGAQLMMQRSAQESGLDEKNLRSLQDLTKPPLFPDFLWHSSGQVYKPEHESKEMVPVKLTQSAIYLIRKGRDIHHRMHTSPFYLRPSQEVDVTRYRKRPRTQAEACDKTVIEHLGKIARSTFVPEELLQPSKRIAAIKDSKKNALLDDLADIKGEPGESDSEGEMDDIEAVDEEEEDPEDYAQNYYASDDESDGGGDDEPTF